MKSLTRKQQLCLLAAVLCLGGLPVISSLLTMQFQQQPASAQNASPANAAATPADAISPETLPEQADDGTEKRVLSVSVLDQDVSSQIWEQLSERDRLWTEEISQLTLQTPAELVKTLDAGEETEEEEEPSEQSSFPDAVTWNHIQITVRDGDGTQISDYSNAQDILSMVHIYEYTTGIRDLDQLSAYADRLWDLSHSYEIRISDMYYCSGCVIEESADGGGDGDSGSFSGDSGGSGSRTSDPVENGSESSAVSAAVETDVSSDETSTAEEAAARRKKSSSAPRPTKQAEDSEPLEGDTSEDGSLEELPEETLPDDRSGLSEDSRELSDEELSLLDGPGINGDGTGEESGQASQSSSSRSGRQTETVSGSGNVVSAAKTSCPGHADLFVNIRVIGAEEEDGNLFVLDQENSGMEWNSQSRESVLLLCSQNWEQLYGYLPITLVFSDSAFQIEPLTQEQISQYLNMLPADISQDRYRMIETALQSVGRIPYYWGGKPSRRGYTGNSFGTLTVPDAKGRNRKGLDCSGWISWVYWTALGRKLPYESTSGLLLCGESVKKDALQPGDLLIRTGSNAHVVMFLDWTADGQILCIHESSAQADNVTLSVTSADWPYYRTLFPQE